MVCDIMNIFLCNYFFFKVFFILYNLFVKTTSKFDPVLFGKK